MNMIDRIEERRSATFAASTLGDQGRLDRQCRDGLFRQKIGSIQNLPIFKL